MDIFSHAGWGYAAVRFKGKPMARWGALLGAAPDLFAFGPFYLEKFFKKGWSAFALFSNRDPNIWRVGGPSLSPEILESYDRFYVYTHSLVILLGGAILFWFIFKRYRVWLWLALPYALHIVMDIPTHERYQTPFLYPISKFTIQGVSWGRPYIFFPNIIALISVHIWLCRRYRSKESTNK